MKKSLISLAVAVTLFVGCGGSGGKSTFKDEPNGNAVTVAGLQEIGKKVQLEDLSMKNLRTTSSTIMDKDDAQDTNPCSNGGTLRFNGDDNSDSMVLVADKCQEGTVYLDGSLEFKDIGDDGGSLKALSDLSFSDSEQNITIEAKKDSIISMGDSQIDLDFDTKINGITLKADNIIIKGRDIDENSSTFYFQSGSLNVGEYYFEVVKQTKDFLVKNSELVEGSLDLKDGAGHKVVLAAEDKKMVLKVDENGDGVFSQDEILSGDLANEDFDFIF